MSIEQFYQQSWFLFDHDPAIQQWTTHTLPIAREQVTAKQHADWLRHNGTWFVGVNALPNDPLGKVGQSEKLSGVAAEFIKQLFNIKQLRLDKGQISVCYPGYPQASAIDSKQAHLYRKRKDSAHVDGLRRDYETNKRYLKEAHSYVLGIPLVDYSADASPLVVWEGSHEIIRRAFTELFDGLNPEQWGEVDVTEIYRHARQEVFDTCKRVAVPAKLGEAFIVHRLAVHGIAPWGETAWSGKDGRMICYFRPEFEKFTDWLYAQ